MATTTPDNILTPDAGDQYALVQDLGLMADSVQDALNRRGNAIKGTAAQRDAALASNSPGVIWQDTDGIGMIWKRGATAWVPAVWRWSGTTTQMNSFTQAPNGFEWANTTDNIERIRLGGVWVSRGVGRWASATGQTIPGSWLAHTASSRWNAEAGSQGWSNGFVAPAAGLYRAEFGIAVTSVISLYAAIKLNNTSNTGDGLITQATIGGANGGSAGVVSRTLALSAGDRLVPATFTSSAGAGTGINAPSTYFNVVLC